MDWALWGLDALARETLLFAAFGMRKTSSSLRTYSTTLALSPNGSALLSPSR